MSSSSSSSAGVPKERSLAKQAAMQLVAGGSAGGVDRQTRVAQVELQVLFKLLVDVLQLLFIEFN